MAFSFLPNTWYRGKARKPFAGLGLREKPPIVAGSPVFFRVHPAMFEHWTVFDGGRNCIVFHTERMKEYVASVRGRGLKPEAVGGDEAEELERKLMEWVRGEARGNAKPGLPAEE